MHHSNPRNWLIAFVLIVLAIVMSMAFIDIPIAKFVHTLPLESALHFSGNGVRALVACAGLVLVGLALHRAAAGEFKPWEETGLLMALSLGWGVSVNEFALKPLFGRPGPGTFLGTGETAFHWLHGTSIDSFPSGHAVQIASVMTVLCIVYPRWRGLWYTLIAAVSLALILGNWHFVSDVIAGNFVGLFGAAMIVTFWQNRQTLR